MEAVITKKYGVVRVRRQEPLFGSCAFVSFADQSGFTFQDKRAETGRFKVMYYAPIEAPRPSLAESLLRTVESATRDGRPLDGDEKKVMEAVKEHAKERDTEAEDPFDWNAAGVNRRRARRA